MSIELIKKYAPKVDEVFKAESKLSLLTNTDYDWTGANAVKVRKITTATMNDYARNRSAQTPEDSISRYGQLLDLDSTCEELLLAKDRSFIFNIDALDQDETGDSLEARSALARQVREVVIPEVDTWAYSKMVAGAGTTKTLALTAENIYDEIITGSKTLDDAEVPETERAIVVTPETYRIMKKSPEIILNCDVGEDMRKKGVVAFLDGAAVVKVPAVRLPASFGFMMVHPSATAAPVKLADYGVYPDTPLSSGTIVTGRVAYDAFVLDNKKKGIYVHKIA